MNFKNITLGDICFIEKGKIGIQAAIPGDYSLVTTAQERSSHNEYHFEGEAVCIPLVSATGHGHASIKRIHFQKGKFCVGNILCACMPKDYNKTSAKFLHLYFSLLKDSILVPLMQGSANVSLKIKDLEKVEVPYVSFERQLKIVNEFQRLEVINNKLLAELDQQQTYLQLFRQTILQEAVQGKLTKQDPTDEPAPELLKRIKAENEKLIKAGKLKKEKELPPITMDEIPFELPEGWAWCRLGKMVDLKSGVTLGKNYKGELFEVPYLRVANVQRSFIDVNHVKTLKVPKSEVEKYHLEKGDLCMIEGGDWDKVGRCAIWDHEINPCIHQNHIFRLRFYGGVLIKWSELYLNSSSARRYFESCSKQTTNLASINRTQLNNLLYPLPPLPEQHRIVAKVQQLQQQLNELDAQVKQSREYAQQLLQTVLKEAFEPKSKLEMITNEEVEVAPR